MEDKMNDPIRCSVCGRFISYDDIDSGAAKYKFTPDTHFTKEYSEFICPFCGKKAEEVK